jgi:CRISPR-associated endonuclease Csn1
MKKILGLDLGTTSIGWALVNEAENENEKSSIIKLGVRVTPLTVDEQQNFEKGKSITTNADRTLKRGMRRNLQRYKLRRENLIEILKEHGLITNKTILSENDNRTTFETYRLRAKAVTEKISLEEFARVLMMINKKRGYKSSRKTKGQDEGQLIDVMDITKELYEENITPGQLCYKYLKNEKNIPTDFYNSDLQSEFNRIWEKQSEYYAFLTKELKEELLNKTDKATWAICAQHFIWTETEKVWNNDEGKNEYVEKEYKLVGIKREGKQAEQKKENIEWRAKAISEKILPEQLVIVFQELNKQISGGSKHLNKIGDRSKELRYPTKQTVGQYQMAILDENPNASLRNMIFYRQDYLDEFNTIWETQAKFHSELTDELKQEIRVVVIFYQRCLKSQKGLLSFCEFESRQIEVEIDGKKRIKTTGSRVIPRSSPLFQEFKIWQRLNDIEVFPANEKSKRRKPNAKPLEQNQKELLFAELSTKEVLTKNQVLTLLDLQESDMKFDNIDGNKTQYELFKAYKKIIELSGHKIGDDFSIETINEIFNHLGINTDILYFDSQKPLDEQAMYKLWHLLYSFEDDKSNTGVENLVTKLKELYGFEKDYAKILAGVNFQKDYGSLSAKAIGKILPLMKMGQNYTDACANIYERHSKSSLTTEELDKKVYVDKLEILPKNSLRNPVVEKILNQMVNVINTIIDVYGKPDEIRIELARELKKNAAERFLLTDSVNTNTEEIKKIKETLKNEFGIDNASRNDVIRYKLWKELAPNGHKPLYGSKENLEKEISPAILFTKEIEIEHILPKARLFDDSFSNKTLVFSSDNKEKKENTAIDYVKTKENGLDDYLNRIINVCGTKTTKKVTTNFATKNKTVKTETKNFESFYKEYERSLKKKEQKEKWEELSETEKKIAIINKYYSNKLKKLVITASEFPDGFIDRDIRDTQYIARYAKTMLGDLIKFVISTTGSITERLREDWQLIDVMKEINFPKYEKLGLIENVERIDYATGEVRYVKKIKDWTKRNDHRHHAMDALTVAFTKRQFIQYLNNLNARRTDEEQSISNTEKEEYDNFAITSEDIILNTRDVLGIERSELYRDGKGKLRFKPPMPLNEFRDEAKKYLENTLISIKAKNKVVTQNINTTKKSGGTYKKVQLTPRGQLHNETIYGSQKQYVIKAEPVNAKFDAAKIATVTKPVYQEALLKRLQQFENNPQKAFTGKNSLTKNPIWLNELHTEQVPERVKTVIFETVYTIRKDISPDLKIDKVVDRKIRKILQERLEKFGGDAKKAFSNLDENPIWLNKEKGISIKRVTISGVNNAESLHDKRDKDGKLILDKDGKKQPVDFINTGNNHHVAIYRDEKGNLQERVVSLYDAVKYKNLNFPIIIKDPKSVWDKVLTNEIDDQNLLEKLPNENWEFLFSMKQNEYFVFPNEKTGFNPNEVDLLNSDNYALISQNLFRVQKVATKDYTFRHHLETTVENNNALKEIIWIRCGINGIENVVKVRVNHIGQIVSVGEY